MIWPCWWSIGQRAFLLTPTISIRIPLKYTTFLICWLKRTKISQKTSRLVHEKDQLNICVIWLCLNQFFSSSKQRLDLRRFDVGGDGGDVAIVGDVKVADGPQRHFDDFCFRSSSRLVELPLKNFFGFQMLRFIVADVVVEVAQAFRESKHLGPLWPSQLWRPWSTLDSLLALDVKFKKQSFGDKYYCYFFQFERWTIFGYSFSIDLLTGRVSHLNECTVKQEAKIMKSSWR